MIVQKAVGCLRPLKKNVRSVGRMNDKKPLVKLATLVLKHTHNYFYACFLQLSDASPLHFIKRIDTSYDHPRHSFLYNEIGTRRRATHMRTRL